MAKPITLTGVGHDGKGYSVEAEIPETLQEAVEMVGEERVLFNFNRQYKNDLRNGARPNKVVEQTPEQKAKAAAQRKASAILVGKSYEELIELGVKPELAKILAS
jgi:thymidylate synthase ThyX